MAKSKYKYLMQRGNVWWIEVNNATYGTIRETTGCTDEDQAHLVLQKRLGMAAEAKLNGITVATKGSTKASHQMTLKEGYERCLREHWRRDTTTSTTVEHNWKAVVKHMDVNMPLVEIKRATLVDFVGKMLAEGAAKGTINRKLSVISTILNKAADEWELLESVPKMPTLKEPEGVRLPMSEDDKAKAMVYLGEGRGKWDADVADLIEVIWGCGARLSEIVGLESHHIDLEKGTISLWDTKNGGYRVLPITDKIKSILANRSEFERPFVMLNKDKVDHTWARVRKACNISPRVCIHSIRHTVISKLIDADLSHAKIMQFVGHNRIETTMRYTHLGSTALSECSKVLE